MPQVRKLTPDEVQHIEHKGTGVRKRTEEQFDDFLAAFNVNDYGEVVLASEDNRQTTRNRLRAAAQRRGLHLTFRRTRGDTMLFKVDAGDGQAPEATVPTQAPAPEPLSEDSAPVPSEPRRRGRKKKDE